MKNKIWGNFQRIIEIFIQKIVTKLSIKMGLGSGTREKPVPDPRAGVKKAPDPRSRSLTLAIRLRVGLKSRRAKIFDHTSAAQIILAHFKFYCRFLMRSSWVPVSFSASRIRTSNYLYGAGSESGSSSGLRNLPRTRK